ncbi:MAG: VCBS repeat-containing protein [Armatimonadota bacterium]|nr:VCBS repeat-containing protein [Armatimonadota bacterium]
MKWISPNRYRVVAEIDHRGVRRLKRPASVRVDLAKALQEAGGSGRVDPYTVEVVTYNADGLPFVYDNSSPHYHRYLVPHWFEPYYGVDYADISFVIPDPSCTHAAVYFDTVESGLGSPSRYTGIVGDGDWFRVGYGRREIGASHMDCFFDLDGDGDLDLFKVTVEPYIYCYENVGGNKYVYRGRLTSGGELFVLPRNPDKHRSWATITFADWDGDGDGDLFVSICDGEDFGHVIRFENVTEPGGLLTFVNRGRFLTVSGKPLGDNWFAAVTVVDWDGDGVKDILVARNGGVEFFHNLGDDSSVSDIKLADGVPIELPGNLRLRAPRVECVDFDGDGDLDIVIAHQGPELYYFENIGTRQSPRFKPPVLLPSCGGGHCGVKVADFDGDGELEYVVSSLWERTENRGTKRNYARLYKRSNSGADNNCAPESWQWEEQDAYTGCPYTEQNQICDAGRQNTVRAVDWNNDGRMDIIACGERGTIRLFRNRTDNLRPLFTDGEVVLDELGPGLRCCVCDWNNDGKKDLVITNWSGHVYVLLNTGTDEAPAFGKPVQVEANGKPIDGTLWCSVLVCDWDGDGRKDLILGMGGEGKKSEHYDWPHQNEDPSQDRGFLFFRNVGTDAEPVFERPKWITAGPNGRPITHVRPNLGSFVDWDGDGKKDFIACEFESVIRLYKNIGSGLPGEEPVLEEGIELVRPKTVMMISGADVVDWHGDGDLDIVTGQGHGGSGIRFFCRSFIEDVQHNTRPIVVVRSVECRSNGCGMDE